ncbi:MAG: DUF3488 domain-containing protein [Opitutales bacterium]|nr:DUF3488 domain-containing protein [Opitutales bacterium]
MPDSGRLHGLRWMLGFALALVAVASVLGIGAEGTAWVLACSALLLLGLIMPARANRLPAFLRPLLLIAVLFHGIGDLLIHGADFLPPMIRLLVMWVTWRALFQQRTRASLQLALGGLLLVLLSGVLRQDLGFGLALGLYVAIALPSLWTIQHCTLVDPPAGRTVKAPTVHSPSLAGLWRSPLWRVGLFGTGLYLLTLGLALSLFYLLPRFEYGHSLPFPQLQGTSSQIGITERLRFGDISSVLQSDERVMRVDTGGQRVPGIPYWRMLVLDEYSGEGFEISEALQAEYRELQNHRFGGRLDDSALQSAPWTFYLEGGVGRFLPTPGYFQQLRFQNRQTLRYFEATQTLALTFVPASTLVFRYEGLERGRSVAGPQEQSAIPEHQWNLDLKDSDSEILMDRFIQRHDLKGREHYDGLDRFALALIRSLQADRGYSLEVQLPEGDAQPLLRWMDADLSGHCEFYAGAMVLLSRALEVPARLVVGFAGGDWNGFEDYYMVRKRHAHAWVELWDVDYGWIRYDPTPLSRMADMDANDTDALAYLRGDRSWEAYMDSLRLLWYRRVIQFDRERQDQLRARGFDSVITAFGQFSSSLKGLASYWFSLRNHSALELALRWLFLLFLVSNVWLFRSQLSNFLLWLARCLLGRLKWEQKIRLQAGRLLNRPGVTRQPHIQRRLLRIRYGPQESWPDPLETFRAAVKLDKRP